MLKSKIKYVVKSNKWNEYLICNYVVDKRSVNGHCMCVIILAA